MRTTHRVFVCGLALVALAAPCSGQDGADSPGVPPRPPSNLRAADHAWDGGTQIDLSWTLSPDDASLEAYQVLRAIAQVGEHRVKPVFQHVDFLAPGTSQYTVKDLRHELDIFEVERDFGDVLNIESLRNSGERRFSIGHIFKIVAVAPDGATSTEVVTAAPLVPSVEWFDGGRFALFIITIVFCSAVTIYIAMARRGISLKVRKIAGLEAVDEAVGRATEMGRSCLFIPGIQDMNEIQTIAGITILSRVAQTAAAYDAKVEVPTARSLVMTACQEAVQSAYLSAGRPDAYNSDLIYYVTDEQFGYVAYLQGMMVRSKPAACFYMGSFFAESLILAETGNSIGAIQVAGTAQPAQLPFFVAACDYTLIGEEFFAASAYLSGSPEELGSLKGQDVGKLIVALILIIGMTLATIAAVLPAGSELKQVLLAAVAYLRDVVLT